MGAEFAPLFPQPQGGRKNMPNAGPLTGGHEYDAKLTIHFPSPPWRSPIAGPRWVHRTPEIGEEGPQDSGHGQCFPVRGLFSARYPKGKRR